MLLPRPVGDGWTPAATELCSSLWVGIRRGSCSVVTSECTEAACSPASSGRLYSTALSEPGQHRGHSVSEELVQDGNSAHGQGAIELLRFTQEHTGTSGPCKLTCIWSRHLAHFERSDKSMHFHSWILTRTATLVCYALF